ncbi:phage major capsid protein [Sunxiuqinia indica]|uniref:phage major capsid protein n=1 Tax=Sunxiuqinia indica TaxID=2692584 RepID=UPI0013574474|nr:phage major capsid protein [Sunxiuqinia indica]
MKLGRLFFGMGKKSNYWLVGLFAFLAITISFMAGGTEAGIMMAMTMPVGLTAEEQAKHEKLLADIKEKNKEQIGEFKKEFQNLGADFRKGLIDEKTFNEKFQEVTSKLEKFDAGKFAEFEKSLEKFEESLKKSNLKLKEFEEGGMGGDDKSLRKEIGDILSTDEFKEFVDSNGKKKASFSLKATSITDNYTGDSRVHITSRDSRVVDHPKVTRLNIRDLLTVMPTDLPYLAFTEVYDWNRAIGMNTENGTLAESSFKVREATADAKRIGTHVPISKRMLKSTQYILNHLMQKLPALVKFFEDFQLLWGDGEGNNVLGIGKVASDFATLVNTTITGAANSVASVASYDSGAKTLVTFAANQNIQNGSTITFASATEATYNAAYKAYVISPTQIVIDLTYVAEADTSAWTFVVNSPFKGSIAAAQQIDALKVGKTLVTSQEYTASGIVLNPIDATLIETLKGNDEHYIDVQRLDNGILTISGIPVVETTAMPAGKFAVGDWAMAAALLEFSELVLEFSESTQEKLGNYVEAIIQEEVLFPIYNKYMFVVGDFSTAVAAIKAA